MTTYKDYTIKGYDVSAHNDNPDTVYFPGVDKLIARGFRFIGIRTSYGIVTDRAFKQFWAEAKGKLDRIPYHYLDFYSHDQMKMGISDEQWGQRQAQAAWKLLKDDPGEFPLFLDVENSSLAKITRLNQSKVGRIVNAFLDEYDSLSGKKAGIYTNQGYLFVFGNSHKTRDLWFSWYNRSVTLDRIDTVLDDWKYTGALRFLQYTSDGDIDDNGKSDSRALGMESDSLDLNVYIGDERSYSGYRTGGVIIEDEPIDVIPDITDAEKLSILWEDYVKRQASRRIWSTCRNLITD